MIPSFPPLGLLTDAYVCFCPDDEKGQCEMPVEIYQRLSTPNVMAVDMDECLTMLMEVELEIGQCGGSKISNKSETKAFLKKYETLTTEEVQKALTVSEQEFLQYLNTLVPCVGCRKSAERAFDYAKSPGTSHTFFPFVMNKEGYLEIDFDPRQRHAQYLFNILYGQSSVMRVLMDWLDKFSNVDKPKRCNLHTSDLQKGSKVYAAWADVWDSLSECCREKATVVTQDTMQKFVNEYLTKNRFCSDCKHKILRAYDVLTGKLDADKEHGVVKKLYEGIELDQTGSVFIIVPDNRLLKNLINRAMPELTGGTRRERHAKTMETAQEEVLTCLGVCLLHRLGRIQHRFRVEERAFVLVLTVATQVCRKRFEVAVDQKFVVGNLDWADAMDKDAEAKRQKKIMKKQRQRKMKKLHNEDEVEHDESKENDKDNDKVASQIGNTHVLEKTVQKNATELVKKISPVMSCDNSQDCGYSSGNNNENISGKTTPFGSDTCCSEGICNSTTLAGKSEVKYTKVIGKSEVRMIITSWLKQLKDIEGDFIPPEIKELMVSGKWAAWRLDNQRAIDLDWKRFLENNSDCRARKLRVFEKKVLAETQIENKITELPTKKPKKSKNNKRSTCPANVRRYKGKNRR